MQWRPAAVLMSPAPFLTLCARPCRASESVMAQGAQQNKFYQGNISVHNQPWFYTGMLPWTICSAIALAANCSQATV